MKIAVHGSKLKNRF